MRMIHPAAWVGLLLNAVLAFIFFHALEVMDLATLEAAQREAWGELKTFILDTVRPLYLMLLLMQTVALVLMVYRAPFALPLAFIGGLLTIPVGFVYLLGSLLTHYQIRYADFVVAPEGHAGAYHIFPAFAVKRMRILTSASFIAFGMLFIMQNLQMAASFLALALVGLYSVLRAGKNHALALYNEGLTLTPGVLAPTLMLPYSNITLATLHENDVIQFEVSTPGGSRSLVWPLHTVAPGQRREAIEELGAALDARGVPLQ
jgi:hypothetical protein